MQSTVRRLTHKARSIVNDLGERNKEREHVRTAMKYNGYPGWMLEETREDVKENSREEEETMVTSGAKREEWNKRPVVIPYIRDFAEELKRTFGELREQTYFKPSNTLWQLLIHSKDPGGRTKWLAQCIRLAVKNVNPHALGKWNTHWRQDLENIGDWVPAHQRSQNIYI